MRLMNDRQLAKWERVRDRGRGRYVWVNGVVGWGLSMAILFPILTSRPEQGWADFMARLALSLALFPLGGYVWGAAMWWLSEAAYRKSRSTPDARETAG